MKSLFALLFVIAALPAHAASGTFVDKDNGVSLAPPIGWVVMAPSPDQVQGDVATRRQRIVQIAKYPADHEGPNPSFVMSVQPLPFAARGGKPSELVRQLIPNLRGALTDLVFEIQPRDVTVHDTGANGSLPGGEMIFRHTAKDSAGNPYPARSRMMYIVRRDQLFAVQTTAPASGPDAADAELREIVASIRLIP